MGPLAFKTRPPKRWIRGDLRTKGRPLGEGSGQGDSSRAMPSSSVRMRGRLLRGRWGGNLAAMPFFFIEAACQHFVQMVSRAAALPPGALRVMV